MSRLRVLIKKDILKKISEENKIGVKILTLIKKYEIFVASSTLINLIGYYRQSLIESPLQSQITSSLYPLWLVENVQLQPQDWSYIGAMPLGEWKKNIK